MSEQDAPGKSGEHRRDDDPGRGDERQGGGGGGRPAEMHNGHGEPLLS